MSVTRSATRARRRELRAGDAEQPVDALRRVIANLLVPFERHASAADRRRHDAAVARA